MGWQDTLVDGFSSLLDWTIVVAFIAVPLIFVVFIFTYKRRMSKYPLDVVIYELRENNLVKTNDRAGRFFLDGIHQYKLKKAKDALPIPAYEWINHCSMVSTNIFDKIASWFQPTIGSLILYRYGSKQYKPVKIKENGVTKYVFKKLTNGNYIKDYKPVDPKKEFQPLKFEVIDWDNMNFMVQEQRATFIRRQRIKEKWEKLVPFMVMGLIVFAFILSLYFSTELIKFGASGVNNQPTVETPPPTNTGVPLVGSLIPAGS